MLDNLFCEAYHQGEKIRAICCHSECKCTSRFACALCVREDIHSNDPNFNFRNIKNPNKILNQIYELFSYNEIKFDVIASEIIQTQIKIYSEATQFLERIYSEIEFLDNIFNNAQNLEQEISQICLDDYVILVANENKSIVDCINDYKQQIFEFHQQVKNYSTQSQIVHEYNKEFQQFLDYLKIKIQEKQEISQNYGQLKQDYEQLFELEDQEKERENSKLKQNLHSQEIKNINIFVGNTIELSEITRQELKQTQFEFLQLGDYFLQKQDIKSAKLAYKLQIKINPENTQGFKKLSECLLAQGKFMKAISCYQIFKGSEQDQIQFQIYTAKALLMNHQLEDSRKLLFDLLQKYPGNKQIRDELGKLFYYLKEAYELDR